MTGGRFEPTVLWTHGAEQCELHRVEGRFELYLRQNGRLTRLQTCENERTARAKASEWLKALDGRRAP